VKRPKWLLRSGEESNVTKSEDLKKVRRQTDQTLKRRDAQKERRDEPIRRSGSHKLTPRPLSP
jgi:hypothetical protein